jgi:hypothetical protein
VGIVAHGPSFIIVPNRDVGSSRRGKPSSA